MRASAADIQRLSERVVEALLRQGYVKAKADKAVLSRRITDLILRNLEEEAAIEAEAEKLAQQHIRRSAGGSAGMDERRVIDMIKKKLAEDRGFSL